MKLDSFISIYLATTMSGTVLALSEAVRITYPDIAQGMAAWGYDWEAHKVTTEDGYVLTTFHIVGKDG